jgi:DNA polymerase III delta prime subunit
MEIPFIYKYQPTLLNEFEMDERVLTFIRTFISMDTLNIIFTGESGCGKSSLISAIIKEYYGPHIKIQNNENILEINSLKDQGISYYRNDVKTFCQTSSLIQGKKKFLILDDIDIINEQSQQVFRNCIDKYSHNVHFIGSCINTQKVIESIQSRMTIIKLKMLVQNDILNIINKICLKEHIVIEPVAKQFVIAISNNSVRNVINYLESFKLLDRVITLEIASAVCTNISFKELETYTLHCKVDKNIQAALEVIYRLIDRGYSVIDILDNYFLYIKTTELLNDDEKYRIIPYICKYITIFHNVHEDEIELVLFTHNLIEIFQMPV